MNLMSRTRPRRRLARTLTVTAAAALLVAPLAATAPANAGGDEPQRTTIRPGDLPRGEDTALLHTERNEIVDGNRRIRLAAAHVTLLGRHGRTYIATTSNRDFESWRLLRVRRDGTTKTLLRRTGSGPELYLDDTGFRFVVVDQRREQTRMRVRNSLTGEVVRSRSFPGPVRVLDYSEGRMVLSEFTSERTRTFWWNAESNAQAHISGRPSYFADITANRLGQLLGDPYQGGCQKVVKLSRPSVKVWRSCRDRVFEVSPNAQRMVTGHILTDGPGPRVVRMRTGTGRLLATLRAEGITFLVWEDDRRLLLGASGKRAAAAVRCVPAECERASKLYPRDGKSAWGTLPWTVPSD
jgi:hypothetical protein